MNTEAHLAVGWLLAQFGGEGRRYRGWVVLSALAPDLDVVTYLLGADTYARWHHVLGHNIFFSLAFSLLATLACRRGRMQMFLMTQLGFYSHYFGDYFLTNFSLQFFWPLSDAEFLFSRKIGLDHPINHAVGYASLLLIIVLAVLYRRTPLELVSGQFDRRVINLFSRKPLRCHICGLPSNEQCIDCSRPVCARHGRLTRRCTVRCSKCAQKPPTRAVVDVKQYNDK